MCVQDDWWPPFQLSQWVREPYWRRWLWNDSTMVRRCMTKKLIPSPSTERCTSICWFLHVDGKKEEDVQQLRRGLIILVCHWWARDQPECLSQSLQRFDFRGIPYNDNEIYYLCYRYFWAERHTVCFPAVIFVSFQRTWNHMSFLVSLFRTHSLSSMCTRKENSSVADRSQERKGCRWVARWGKGRRECRGHCMQQ